MASDAGFLLPVRRELFPSDKASAHSQNKLILLTSLSKWAALKMPQNTLPNNNPKKVLDVAKA
jgi:hypothetical protein